MNTTSAPAIASARILNEDKCSLAMLRYWRSKAKQLANRVDFVDPFRASLRDLREALKPGTRVYRCSTGGRWGKSATIVTL